jgi:hypothetical protein
MKRATPWNRGLGPFGYSTRTALPVERGQFVGRVREKADGTALWLAGLAENSFGPDEHPSDEAWHTAPSWLEGEKAVDEVLESLGYTFETEAERDARRAEFAASRGLEPLTDEDRARSMAVQRLTLERLHRKA